MQPLSWDNYRFIIAIHRCNTLAAAARQLAVNETTVARRLAQTEKQLGARLFKRRQSVLQATESGLALLRHIELAKQYLDEAESIVTGADGKLAGSVRIASDALLRNLLLVPQVGQWLTEHPSLHCELAQLDWSDPLRYGDIAIVLMDDEKQLSDVNVQVLGELDFHVYTRNDSDTDLENRCLALINCRAPHYPTIDSTDCRTLLNSYSSAEPSRLTVECPNTLLDLLLAGTGAGLLPSCVGDRQPSLIRLDADCVQFSRTVTLLHVPEMTGSSRLQACVVWLQSALTRFEQFSSKPVSPVAKVG